MDEIETVLPCLTDPPEALRDHSRRYVLAVLERFQGNRAAAAHALGLSLRGLQYMLRRWREAGLVEQEL